MGIVFPFEKCTLKRARTVGEKLGIVFPFEKGTLKKG